MGAGHLPSSGFRILDILSAFHKVSTKLGEAQDSFSGATVREVEAYSGAAYYSTYNAESRLVVVRWSRVLKSGLIGYHVYRRCRLGATDYHAQNRVDALSCEPAWVRLTDAPIDPADARSFWDTTIGGLMGGYQYLVRPVGPEYDEGTVSKGVEVSLYPGVLEPDQCRSLGNDPLDPGGPREDAASWQTAATHLANINGIQRGTGTGAPNAPQVAAVRWWDTVAPPRSMQGSKYVWVSWARGGQPRDLAGYHVEMATS
jgi:hypothetical protein